ncbi:MAG: SDR family oxidoreductase, partial [Sphingomonas sp.]
MTIIVTGSSRGIGASILATLRDGGHAVIGQATATGNGADIAADFADPAAPRALWDAALARAGGTIDVLINNAGVFEANPLDRASDDWVADWERTQRINLTAAAELCRLAVLHWQDRKVGGRIVNIASRAAYRGDSPAH